MPNERFEYNTSFPVDSVVVHLRSSIFLVVVTTLSAVLVTIFPHLLASAVFAPLTNLTISPANDESIDETRQGASVHSRLSSLSHCGLIWPKNGIV